MVKTPPADGGSEPVPEGSPAATDAGPGFADFWALYPRRVNKGSAESAWLALVNGQREKAIEGATVMAAAWKGSTAGRRTYCPHPGSWLRGQRWSDDPAEVYAGATAREVAPPPREARPLVGLRGPEAEPLLISQAALDEAGRMYDEKDMV